MAGDEKRHLRDEVAALAEAVRELRVQLATHHCHGCQCIHWHFPPAPAPVPYYPVYPVITQPYTVTCESGISTAAIPGTVTTTNALASAS